MRTIDSLPDGVPKEFDEQLHPGRRYDQPADVLADASLTVAERRAILSAWASDACAVVSTPLLRRALFATRPVTFDEIMDALVDLDRVERPANPTARRKAPGYNAHRASSSRTA